MAKRDFLLKEKIDAACGLLVQSVQETKMHACPCIFSAPLLPIIS